MIREGAHPEQERLMEFIDGTLSSGEREEIAGHTKECARCARLLAELSRVDTALRHLPREAPSGNFTMNVLRRIEGGAFTDAAYRLLVRVSAGAGMVLVGATAFAILIATGTITLPGAEADSGVYASVETLAQNALLKFSALAKDSTLFGSSAVSGKIGVLAIGVILVMFALAAADQFLRRGITMHRPPRHRAAER
jgi:hypothetical protein